MENTDKNSYLLPLIEKTAELIKDLCFYNHAEYILTAGSWNSPFAYIGKFHHHEIVLKEIYAFGMGSGMYLKMEEEQRALCLAEGMIINHFRFNERRAQILKSLGTDTNNIPVKIYQLQGASLHRVSAYSDMLQDIKNRPADWECILKKT